VLLLVLGVLLRPCCCVVACHALQAAVNMDKRNPLARFEIAGVLTALDQCQEALAELRELQVTTAMHDAHTSSMQCCLQPTCEALLQILSALFPHDEFCVAGLRCLTSPPGHDAYFTHFLYITTCCKQAWFEVACVLIFV
jgi:hypothetical protein